MFNLERLTRPLNFKRARVSSYDKSGGNADAWPIAPGETKVLADLTGPGVISHIWFTISSPDHYYLRKLALRIYWDGEANPSVSCPVGDFFGLGHSVSMTYSCALFSTSCNSGRDGGSVGDGVAMNCWAPMPFRNRRIETQTNRTHPSIPSISTSTTKSTSRFPRTPFISMRCGGAKTLLPYRTAPATRL